MDLNPTPSDHQTNTLSFELSRPQSAIFHLNNVTTSQPVSDNKSTFYCNEW